MNITIQELRILSLICLSSAIPGQAKGDALDHWQWRNPLPQGNTLVRLAYGNHLYVAVGDRGAIVVSADGTNWETRVSGTTNDLRGVCYGKNLFVVVGRNGTVLTSLDGRQWMQQNSGTTTKHLHGLTYGNGRFMAVGEDPALARATIWASADGTNWTAQTAALVPRLASIVYHDTFVAVGGTWIMTSTNGVDWASHNTQILWWLSSVCHGNDRFVAVGGFGTVLQSLDGITWTQEGLGPSGSWNDVAYGNGAFFAAGDNGRVVSSADGIQWIPLDTPIDTSLLGICRGEQSWVTAGQYGMVLASESGTNWRLGTRGFNQSLYGMAYGNGTYVALGLGTNLISTDGMDWIPRPSGTSNFLGRILFANGLFVAVGSDSSFPYESPIMISPDGMDWQPCSSGTLRNLTGLAYGAGRYVAAGEFGTVLSSTNAVDWTVHPIEDNHLLSSVAYGNGTFAAAGYEGRVVRSQDGTHWIVQPVGGTYDDFLCLAYGNGQFVMGDRAGNIWNSTDAIQWSKRPLAGINVTILNYLGSVFAGWSTRGELFISEDATNWIRRAAPTSTYLHDIGFANGTLFLLGDGGGILQSDPLLRLRISFQETAELQVFGVPGLSCSIQAADDPSSTNLWQTLTHSEMTAYPFFWRDSFSTNTRPRFYRCLLSPHSERAHDR